MKEKQYILDEIRRTAANNGGKPVGQQRFRTETGISEGEWKGVYWTRWGDALSEAGFGPLVWNQPLGEIQILEELAKLVRKYGRFPTKAEIRIERISNPQVPAHTVPFRRFGGKAEIIQKLRNYCLSSSDYADICVTLGNETDSETDTIKPTKASNISRSEPPSGFVYLVKSGRRYKIGHTRNHWQRKSDLHKQTAEGIKEIHTIAAIDDAPGIERYWHERFATKRQHGEWFDLSPEDISAFRKRKFM